MAKQLKFPETLMEAIRYFADPDACEGFVASMRWPEGPICPNCESNRIGRIETRKMFHCKDCRKQFSIKKGTIFEDSSIGLDKWLCAIWMHVNCKNGVSSYEVHRALGVTQKTAWFMGQRIRLALHSGSFEVKLGGKGDPVEVDETFVGGRARYMHKSQRVKKIKGAGTAGKVVVLGVLERGGSVRTEVVTSTRRKTLDPQVRKHVEKGSEVHTHALATYESLRDEYVHETIDHARAYVRGHVHTNGMENYWSLLKRTLKGTYVSVEPFHLFRYLDEQAYRFNNRKNSDRERFEGATRGITEKRLTYEHLIGKVTSSSPVTSS